MKILLQMNYTAVFFVRKSLDIEGTNKYFEIIKRIKYCRYIIFHHNHNTPTQDQNRKSISVCIV